jgi:hypothetical protein
MQLQKPNIKDRQRWFLWRTEKPIEEIAARERVSVDAVKKSIDKVQMYHFAGSFEEVGVAYNHMALEIVEEQRQVLKSAMVAETWRTIPSGKGKEVLYEPTADHATRLEALRVGMAFASLSRPKEPANQINIQQNNANGMGGNSGGGMSFEQRIREIRARRQDAQLTSGQVLLAPPPPQKSQVEILADEFEDAGIDLDDEDLDELEVDTDEDAEAG